MMDEGKSGLVGWDRRIGISKLEIDSIVNKIIGLTTNDIDLLWFKSGWIDEEAKADKRKALPNWRLEKIKSDKDFAEESFINLVNDEPYRELRTASVFLRYLYDLAGDEL